MDRATTEPFRRATDAGARRAILVALAVGLGAIALIGPFIGPRAIDPATVLAALTRYDPTDSAHILVWEQRLPRALLGLTVGACLGVAGALLQTLTRNPLADPTLFGVSGGASLGIVLAIALAGQAGMGLILWAAILGAGVAGALVVMLGGTGHGHDPVRMILIGAALSIVFLTLCRIVTINADETLFDRFRHWSAGSLQGRDWSVLWPVLALSASALAGALWLARALDVLALGSELGHALGADPRRTWTAAALLAVVLTGAATAAAGPVGFVGLAAPHLVRRITGPHHLGLIAGSAAAGAGLVGLADLTGRIVGGSTPVDAGIMAALLGGPVFVALARSDLLERTA